jgi:hypothetical protein
MRGTVGNVCVGERETLTLCGVCEDSVKKRGNGLEIGSKFG